MREFVAEFRGLARTAKQKAVLDYTRLARLQLSTLRTNTGLDAVAVDTLLRAMQDNSAPVKPEMLGIIGEDHMRHHFGLAGCEMASFRYKRVAGTTGSLPWVIEAAFGMRQSDSDGDLVAGINFSPALVNPFMRLGYDSLAEILANQWVRYDEPVILALHMVSPRPEYHERSKSVLTTLPMDASVIVDLVKGVTAVWTKQRKAEERHDAAREKRLAVMTESLSGIIWLCDRAF